MADEAALLDLALSGDEAAFTAIVAPLHRELHVHCYRMLGSFEDADDALQETLLAAWRGLGSFGKRASVRTWLYRIATNTCLNLLRAAARRPPQAHRLPGYGPEPNAHTEITWLQPYPDVLLDELPADAPGPQDLAERSDSVSLAFTAAVQALTPRARAVLVMRDVLGFTAAETAAILESTQDAVAMTLSRARAALRDARPSAQSPPAPAEDSAKLAEAFAAALAARDINAVVRLLADDVRFSMPPVPAVWQGRQKAAAFLSQGAFRLVPEALCVPVGANRQPALAIYARDVPSGAWRANGLLVITTRATAAGGEITAVTRFDASRLRGFGLPGILAG
ncbi:MAG: polymerase sigma70 factor [Actinomycetia bacterium]|nr:polymerase sigma70 factor [Actinomycetes bacterium]